MSEQLHPVPKEFAAQARIRAADYERDYAESLRDPDGFWGRIAQRLQWSKPFTRVKDTSFDPDDFRIHFLEFAIVVPTGRQFLNSRRGEVQDIKFEQDVFGPAKAAEFEFAALGTRQLEFRSFVPDFKREKIVRQEK